MPPFSQKKEFGMRRFVSDLPLNAFLSPVEALGAGTDVKTSPSYAMPQSQLPPTEQPSQP